jgi:16S rRNA G966 N2-methylase RsmD
LSALDSGGTFADYVFLDPPYEMTEAYAKVLSSLAQSSLLKPETLVVAEHQKKFDPAEKLGALHRYRKLVQGDAALSFYRKHDEESI